jgi:hypothetical protein
VTAVESTVPRVHLPSVYEPVEVTDVERCCHWEDGVESWCGYWRGMSLGSGFSLRFRGDQALVTVR